MNKKKSLTVTRKTYFHISAVENVDSILTSGLRGGTSPRNRGHELESQTIFVFDQWDEGLANTIAIHQIWPLSDIAEYAVFEVQIEGISGQVAPDVCGELVDRFQWMIRQALIAPEYITLHSVRTLNFPGRAAFKLMLDAYRPARWERDEWELAFQYIHEEIVLQRLLKEIRSNLIRLSDWDLLEDWKQYVASLAPGFAAYCHRSLACLNQSTRKPEPPKKRKRRATKKSRLFTEQDSSSNGQTRYLSS